MTVPLSIATLWRETLIDARVLMPLALPVAAAFVLLPEVAVELFGPPLPTTMAAMTPTVVLIDLVLPALIGVVAQAAIVRLALDQRGGVARSVGEALAIALRTWPLIVVALFAIALPVGAALLLILPGLYLTGRLSLIVPLVVDGHGAVAAIERSWALTAGNGWRVIGFTLLFAAWFIVVSAATGIVGAGIAALFKGAGLAGAGAIVASTLGASVAAVFAVFNSVAMASVYRHLR